MQIPVQFLAVCLFLPVAAKIYIVTSLSMPFDKKTFGVEIIQNTWSTIGSAWYASTIEAIVPWHLPDIWIGSVELLQ